jgi:intracellular sulfur oxidation DsrE/DsrF family protein
MKIKIMFTLFVMTISGMIYSQKSNLVFHGAEARLSQYKALYILDQSDNKKIHMVVKNINNALEDPRLKGKLQIELIAFGDGTEIYKKANHYDSVLLALKNKGVLLAQCENTLSERRISKEDLWPFISFVPSGNGEIIIRQYQGWAIVHP